MVELWQFAAGWARVDMRRVIAIAVAGASLGGCSSTPSLSSFSDYFKSTPPAIQVQLESQPAGADAKTSLGPGCKTPCSVSVPAPDTGFTVTFALPKFEPATVPVNVIRNPDGPVITDPNPVFAELRPAGPPPRSHKAMKPKTVKKRPKATAAPAESPFPDPNAPPPPGTAPSR
jgi:hypothetical protein